MIGYPKSYPVSVRPLNTLKIKDPGRSLLPSGELVRHGW